MFEGGFEVVDDFLSDHIGIWEIGGVFEGVVFEPEEIEAGFGLGVKSFVDSLQRRWHPVFSKDK